MSEFNNLKLDVENEIAVLTISRPAALNALNSETLDELNTALTEIEGRDDIKVVILTGGPDKKDNADGELYSSGSKSIRYQSFCSILQINEYASGNNRSR